MGFTSTRTPFDSVQSVMFCAAMVFSLTTRPAVGTVDTSAPSASCSFHGSMFAAKTTPNTARISASVGTANPAFSGTDTVTTRLAAPLRPADTAFTSARVMLGSSRPMTANSKAMPGEPSPER